MEPTASDVKVFVPARDYALSKAFYLALGWRENWEHDGKLAELELANARFLLQDYYVREWADNFMIYVTVEDADAWWRSVTALIEGGRFEGIRVGPPQDQPWGDRVTHVWDPSGVLLHFAQQRAPSD